MSNPLGTKAAEQILPSTVCMGFGRKRDLMLAPCDHFQSVTSADLGYVSGSGKGRRNQRGPSGHAWEERKEQS